MSGVISNAGFRIERYLAPETMPTTHVCRLIRLPVDPRIFAAVSDVLVYLAMPGVWEDTPNVKDADMQALMSALFLDFSQIEWSTDMIGAVVAMAVDVLPDHMVWCEGQTLQRVDYPDLYGRLNPVFIIDADTFTVPDLRERFVFGTGIEGETAYDVGGTGGQATVELTGSEMPTHYHLTHSHTTILGVAPGEAPISAPSLLSEATDNAGLGNAHENMPPYFVLRFAMVAKRSCC